MVSINGDNVSIDISTPKATPQVATLLIQATSSSNTSEATRNIQITLLNDKVLSLDEKYTYADDTTCVKSVDDGVQTVPVTSDSSVYDC